VKLLEENIREILQDFVMGKDFLDKTPKAQTRKAKADKWDNIKLESFYAAKENNQQN
jgi:hypothetical protein